jgi:hypothetical protein
MILRILLLTLLPLLSYAQINSKEAIPKNTQSNDKGPVELKRNALYNLEEIKVRWKKAALENCPGVPCVVAPSFSCGTSAITDINNNSYNTVSVGTQCWMKENLRVRKYNDGTEIRFDASGGVVGTTSQTWSGMGLVHGAYTLFAHDSMATPSNLTSYGYLYNWYAANGISSSGNKNICPSGWHVPSNSDWNKLVKFIDPSADTTTASVPHVQSSTAGGKLKSTSNLWNTSSPSSPGTDNYGFSALPGASRFVGGSFGNVGYDAFFWSTTEIDVNYARNRHLNKFNNAYEMCGPPLNHKSNGASVRCLKD